MRCFTFLACCVRNQVSVLPFLHVYTPASPVSGARHGHQAAPSRHNSRASFICLFLRPRASPFFNLTGATWRRWKHLCWTDDHTPSLVFAAGPSPSEWLGNLEELVKLLGLDSWLSFFEPRLLCYCLVSVLKPGIVACAQLFLSRFAESSK